jgi:predicted nucleic acid-binding Zn ribbon protein
MPTYVYETVPGDTGAPARRFEVVQRMSDEPLRVDPETGEPVRRVITGGIGLIGQGTKPSKSVCEDTGGPCCGGMCGLN